MTIHDLVTLQRTSLLQYGWEDVSLRQDALSSLSRIIQRRKKDILSALKLDLGKSAMEAEQTELQPVLHEINYMVLHLRRLSCPHFVATPSRFWPAQSRVVPEPYGLVLIFSPWDDPFQLSLLPLIGAIAAGNCCILKPSAYTPATSRIITEIISECFPLEKAAVVLGGQEENQALLNEKFDFIFFTGGKTVGKMVLEQAAQFLTPVTMILGGKNPCIVDETANLQTAAKRIAAAKALNAGQSSLAPDFLLVQKNIHDELLSLIHQAWQDTYDQALESDEWPRMIHPSHHDRVMNLMQNQQIYCGGHGNGIKIEPTILTDVSWDAPVMQEEIFGPVLPVISFEKVDDFLPILKKQEKPLALYVFSQNADTQEQILQNLSFGSCCINHAGMQWYQRRLPYGGVGNSGMGQYHGKFSFQTFSHQKAVLKTSAKIDVPWQYPFQLHSIMKRFKK